MSETRKVALLLLYFIAFISIIVALGCKQAATEVQCKWRADTAYAADGTMVSIKQFSCR